jgi:hypothetical protein
MLILQEASRGCSPIRIGEWGKGLTPSHIGFHSSKNYPFQDQYWEMWVIHFTHTELVTEWCGATWHGQVSHILGQHPLIAFFFLSGNGWQVFSLLRKNPSSWFTLLRCSSAISTFPYEGNNVLNTGQLLQLMFEFVCSKSHGNPHSVVTWRWDWYVMQSYPTTGLDRSLGLQEIEAPIIPDNQQMMVIRLSDLCTGCLYPHELLEAKLIPGPQHSQEE